MYSLASLIGISATFVLISALEEKMPKRQIIFGLFMVY